MISALKRFDDVTAAGILARAALAIDGNPSGSYRIPDEESVREQLIAEVMRRHGLRRDDHTPRSMEQLSDLLDVELDTLIAPSNSEEALERLSTRGSLPSDLFKIEIVNQVSDFHGRKFDREERLIQKTVRSPDREQHYGPSIGPDVPAMISLFAKYFPNEYPIRSFTMLVAGQRNGLTLRIHQAWRVYPDIALDGAPTLVDLLHCFSDQFGFELTVGDKTGNFFLSAALPQDIEDFEATFEVRPESVGKNRRKRLTFSYFFQHAKPAGPKAALLVAIDLDKYRSFLESRGY